MANKFLGEAGLNVIINEIHNKMPLGAKFAAVLKAIEVWGQFDGSSSPNPEQENAWRIFEAFRNTKFGQELGITPTMKPDAVLSMINDFASSKVSLYQQIQLDPFMEAYYLSPYTSATGVDVQEITAQEVTDKFNS